MENVSATGVVHNSMYSRYRVDFYHDEAAPLMCFVGRHLLPILEWAHKQEMTFSAWSCIQTVSYSYTRFETDAQRLHLRNEQCQTVNFF